MKNKVWIFSLILLVIFLITGGIFCLNKEKEEKARLIKEINAAKELDDKILTIGEVTLDDLKLITELNLRYENLPKEVKPCVEHYDILKTADAKWHTLQAKDDIAYISAKKVDALIDDIASPVTIDDKDAIHKARNAYNQLDQDAKEYVSSYDKLYAAELSLFTLTNAKAFTDSA